ncbi:hypothetical protein NLU13_9237 [Sarocladium strictum]|uniref:Uncharacterized protein n=1 Tax=Sarocladium strictum TaxID=5046 RepID=A0AA39GAC7_SARSR|nr:hypothetical protein NLU13_9237 [Sarocladium strictum]
MSEQYLGILATMSRDWPLPGSEVPQERSSASSSGSDWTSRTSSSQGKASTKIYHTTKVLVGNHEHPSKLRWPSFVEPVRPKRGSTYAKPRWERDIRGSEVRRPNHTNKAGQQQHAQEQHDRVRFKHIEKPAPLPSYVAQVAHQLHMVQQTEIEKYLGDPPAGLQLIQLRMVLPRELDSLKVLDETRRSKEVWITRVDWSIIDVHAESMKSLRGALKEINWFMHDMLREDQSRLPRLLLQSPTRATEQSRILLSALRPRVDYAMHLALDTTAAVKKVAASITAELNAQADVILGGIKELEMRAKFGYVQLDHNRSSLGKSVLYGDLEKHFRNYGHHGDTKFESRFLEPHRAELLLLYLLDPANGACGFPESMRESCSVTFSADRLELSADIVGPSAVHPQVAGMRLLEVELEPRLNLITVCPDFTHDWNLSIRSSEHKNVSKIDDKLVMKLSFRPAQRFGPQDVLKQPSIEPFTLGKFGNKVTETRLRTSAIVPWKTTPYLVEIGVTTVWKGINLGIQPRVFWDVQVYGNHWESAVNRVRSDIRRKDWGPDMCDVWTGEEKTMTGRMEGFVKEMLGIQAVLEEYS